MTIAEANALASRNGATLRASLQSNELELHEKGTSFYLTFEGERLQSVQRARAFGFDGGRLSPTLNLCTGERTVRAFVENSRAWDGAQLFVDGKLLPTPNGSAEVDLNVNGTHEIRLVKPGREPYVRKVIVPEAVNEEGEIRIYVQ